MLLSLLRIGPVQPQTVSTPLIKTVISDRCTNRMRPPRFFPPEFSEVVSNRQISRLSQALMFPFSELIIPHGNLPNYPHISVLTLALLAKTLEHLYNIPCVSTGTLSFLSKLIRHTQSATFGPTPWSSNKASCASRYGTCRNPCSQSSPRAATICAVWWMYLAR